MWRLVLLLGLTLGCASSAPSVRPEPPPKAQPSPSASAPSKTAPPIIPLKPPATARTQLSLEEASKRELPPLPKHRVEPPSHDFSGEVEAAGDITFEHSERFTILTIPLGTESPLLCFIYEEPLDAGGSLLGLAKALEEEAAIQRMTTTDVLDVSGAPAVFLRVDYTTQTQSGEKAVGQVKMMVHVTNERPVLCAHDEPGYSQAFRRITTGLSASLTRKPVPSRYSEIQVVRYGDEPLGFEWREVRDAEQGLRSTETTTSLLLPNSEHLLEVEDSTSTVLTDPSGRVQEFSYAKASNGALSVQLSAHREDTTYKYEGTHAERPVRGSFPSRSGLTTPLAVCTALRDRLLSGKESQLTFQLFEPWVNPGEGVDVVYRRNESAGPRAITLTEAGRTLEARLDAQGCIEEQQLPVGQGGFRLQRLSAHGTP